MMARGGASTAPIVQPLSPGIGAEVPVWSVRGQTWTPCTVVFAGITKAAGLANAGSMVWVAPPLLASDPSWGSAPEMSPGALKEHEPSLSRL